MKKNRILFCDFLRFLAIASVISIHVLFSFRESYLAQNHLNYFLLTFFDSFTRAGVPIFFMLTGIFMFSSEKKEKYITFIKKRIVKLIFPFFVISFLYYVYDIIVGDGSFSLFTFLSLFTNNGIKYHFWFMYSIILIYLLIPFLKSMVQNMEKKELATLIIVIFLGNVLATLTTFLQFFNISAFNSFIFPSLIREMSYLFLGYYLYHYGVSKKYHKFIYLSGIFSVLLMALGNTLIVSKFSEDVLLTCQNIFPFISACALFIFVKENYNKWKLSSKIEEFFQKTSPFIFYIYMFHVLVIEIVRRFMLKVYIPERFLSTCIFIVFEYILTFLISYLVSYFAYYIEKKILNLKCRLS